MITKLARETWADHAVALSYEPTRVMFFDRRRPDRLLSGAAVAVTVAAVGVLAHRGATVLTRPPTCPAASELTAVWMARAAPDLALGQWLRIADVGTSVVGLVLLACFVYRLTGRWLVAAAIGTAVGALPFFDLRFAPFSTAGFLAASVYWFFLVSPGARRGTPTSIVLRGIALAAMAAIAPPLTIPLALAAGATVLGAGDGPRRLWPAMAALGLVVLVTLVEIAILPLPGITAPGAMACLLPFLGTPQVTPAGALVSGLAISAGGLASALLILGAFVIRAHVRDRAAWSGLLVAGGPVVVAMWAAVDPALLAPTLVACAGLAAVGLNEVLNACGSGLGGRLAAASFLALVPLVHLVGLRHPVPAPEDVDRGDGSRSLRQMTRLLDRLPSGSRLVEEDAMTSVLLRAAEPFLRLSQKSVVVIPRDPSILDAAARAGHGIYALPSAAREFESLGFRSIHLTPDLVSLARGATCQPLAAVWRTVADGSQASSLAISARGVDDEGPLLVYVAFADKPSPTPVDWPAAALRGFHATVYGVGDLDRFAGDAHDDGLALDWPASGTPYRLRLELWRTPGAPLRLAIGLGATPIQATARVDPGVNPGHMAICPAYPEPLRPPGS